MRKLSTEKRAAVVAALCEGNSINATCRMAGVAKKTVLRLLADFGQFCADYHDLMVRGLSSKRVQVDEIWGFCGCKDKAKAAGAEGHGSVWTWIGLDADSKLCVSYLIGDRGASCAEWFVRDLASRLESRIQLTSDGHKVYADAVDAAFQGQVDYAMLVKVFGQNNADDQRRYSPAECRGCKKEVKAGAPDKKHISTSYVERQNLTVRMSVRRMTRLTNGFSKKIDNHVHALALHFFHYNFIRRHQTLKTTPAVAAGIASKPLTVLDLVAMVEKEESLLGGRLTDYIPAQSKKLD